MPAEVIIHGMRAGTKGRQGGDNRSRDLIHDTHTSQNMNSTSTVRALGLIYLDLALVVRRNGNGAACRGGRLRRTASDVECYRESWKDRPNAKIAPTPMSH